MTDLELAQNVTTAPDALAKLASSRVAKVRLAVARNPNSPAFVLAKLAVFFPKAVLENPLLEWLRFENPAWFTELPAYARLSFLASEACPSAWLTSPDLDLEGRLAALQNPLLPPELLTTWAALSESRVLDALSSHRGFNTDNLLRLDWLDFDRNTELFKDVIVAGLPLEKSIFEVLVSDFDSELRGYLAARSDLPQALIETLALDEDVNVARVARQQLRSDFAARAEALALGSNRDLLRLAKGGAAARRLAALHSSISQRLLIKLATDEDWRVRQAVAQNARCPGKILQRLAQDSDRDVREAVANNPNTITKTLELLLADSHEAVQKAAREHVNAPTGLVRLMRRLEAKDPTLFALEKLPKWLDALVAAHPNTSFGLLEGFAKHDWSVVRISVAGNPNAPQRLLEVLLDDSDADVPATIAARLHLPDALAQKFVSHADTKVRLALANNPNLAKSHLEMLATDSQWEVRLAVAKHPRCPIGHLELLAQDTDADVRLAAVHHDKANAEVAKSALGVELRLPQVLRQLEAHDLNLTSDWLEFAARRGNDSMRFYVASHPNLPWDVMEWFLSQDWKIRLELAKNPMLPGRFLMQLVSDPDFDVRVAIALHSNTPLHLLQKLATDEDPRVRMAVAKHPECQALLIWDEDETVLEAIPKNHPHWLLRQKLESQTPLSPSELEFLIDLNSVFVLQRLPRDTVLPNLESMLTHDHWQIRLAAVQNIHCNLAQLESVQADTDRDVRAAIVQHPNCSTELLHSFLRDEDILVRRVALAQPKLDKNLLQFAQTLILDENLRSSTLNRIVALRLTKRVTELKKRRNHQSLEWRERLAVAQNPSTPKQILEKLSQDTNRLVQETALVRLEGKS